CDRRLKSASLPESLLSCQREYALRLDDMRRVDHHAVDGKDGGAFALGTVHGFHHFLGPADLLWRGRESRVNARNLLGGDCRLAVEAKLGGEAGLDVGGLQILKSHVGRVEAVDAGNSSGKHDATASIHGL